VSRQVSHKVGGWAHVCVGHAWQEAAVHMEGESSTNRTQISMNGETFVLACHLLPDPGISVRESLENAVLKEVLIVLALQHDTMC